jgi:heterotetrameric sarcosine oxidase gamma subunit
MADRHSALGTSYARGPHGKPGEPGVRLQEIKGLVLHQVAAWPQTVTQVGDQLAQVIGCTSAPDPGHSATGSYGIALRVEPLKWWLLNAEPPQLSADSGATLDLSHSRTHIRISGPEAATCLNRFIPIDLRESHFTDGQVASSGFHHVGVTLWRSPTGLDLFVPRGFALSLWEMLLETAEQFGLDIS